MSAFDIREAPPTAAASGYRCALVRWAGAPQGSSSAVRNGRRLLTVCSPGEEDPERGRAPAPYKQAEHIPRLGGPRDLISQADYNTSVGRRQASPSRRNRHQLSGLEPVELAGGGAALAVKGLDLRPPRALVQEGLELVEPVGGAFGLDPAEPAGQVLGIAGEPELGGLALHGPAEPDPLDLPLDDGPEPHVAPVHRGTTPAVPRTPPLMPGW